MKKNRDRRSGWKKLNYKICIAALFTGLLCGLLTYTGSINSVDFWVTDRMFQPDNNAELPITILMIDEETTNRMGLATNWQRDIYADLINKLYSNGCEPAVMIFDILFTESKSKDADDKFAKACAEHDNIVTGVYFEIQKGIDVPTEVKNGKRIVKEIGVINGIARPYEALDQATVTGFTNNEVNNDGFFRNLITYYNYNGEVYEPLGLVGLKIYCNKNGIKVRNFSPDEQSFMFTYSTKADKDSQYQYFPIWKVLGIQGENDTEEIEDFDPILTDGQIVLVGGYTAGVQDNFLTPADRKTQMFGVKIHANIMEAIYQDKIQVLAPNTLISIIYGVLLACLTILAYIMPLSLMSLTTVSASVIQTITCIVLYKNGTYLKFVYFIFPAILIMIVAIVTHYLNIRTEKMKINKAFKMYVAPEIVDEMANGGKYELNLEGQTKDIAVLFIDIRGFTSMSEQLPPKEIVNILNDYFELVTQSIFKNKGTIDKFVGDAAMAVFNSPNDLDDYIYRAVHTAWDIKMGTQDLVDKIYKKHNRTIEFGIGVNCGPATVGNIGSNFRMDYTAIGDTVNVAARLEANAGAGQILISQNVLDQISEWVETEKVEGIKLKGKTTEFNIYNITKVIDKPDYDKINYK